MQKRCEILEVRDGNTNGGRCMRKRGVEDDMYHGKGCLSAQEDCVKSRWPLIYVIAWASEYFRSCLHFETNSLRRFSVLDLSAVRMWSFSAVHKLHLFEALL